MVPMMLTGTAAAGIRVARTLPRKMKTTSTTRAKASSRVLRTWVMVSATKVELS